MKKAVLAIWHTGSKGKSETLRSLANLLLAQYPERQLISSSHPVPIPAGQDFQLVIRIDGLIVAVDSRGDPNTQLRERLIELDQVYKAGVIFCSCRTKGDTVHAIEEMGGRAFEVIWTSTYQIARDQDIVNALKARHILELMRSLELLPECSD